MVAPEHDSASRVWKQDEYHQRKDKYVTNDGVELFVYEHPVSRVLTGVRKDELDKLRLGFAEWLREELKKEIAGTASRQDVLARIANSLYSLLRKSPAPHDWLRLPADNRVCRNRSTIAHHAILVSAFACAMTRAWVAAGKVVDELLRFATPFGEKETVVQLEELMHFVRIGSLCHDFGKHPPSHHNVRGKEQVRHIFSDLMDDMVVEHLSEFAHRHHTGRFYHAAGESPIGPLEELVAHADTLASASDRPMYEEEAGDSKERCGAESFEPRSDKPVSEKDVENPLSSVTAFFRESLGSEKALCLISADTDRVKSYVFETARLPEVRGASALLTKLNERRIASLLWEKFRLPPECLLYAAGGSALVVAPTALAADIADGIERIYISETGAATISVVHRPTTPAEWVRGVGNGRNFGDLVEWIGYDLRRAKDSRAFYPLPDVPPYVKRCDSCEVRPAQTSESSPDGREVFLCAVCGCKRVAGREQKPVYLKMFEEEFLQSPEGAQTSYGTCFTRSREEVGEVHFARDLHEIAEGAEGKARGYVGIIYTDGNDIGGRLGQSQTPAEYRTLSEELRHVTQYATFKALAQRSLLKKITRPDGRTEVWIHPFEIVVIGGDDVFLIVPGDVALDIALGLCENFQCAFDNKLTMSAGVLIMREHLPIYYARNIVDALLKSAKKAGRQSRKPDDPIPAFIDFQAITGDSSLSENLEEYRAQVYGALSPFNANHRLTQRPYRLKDLRRLLETARWVHEKGFPTSQLYQLRHALIEHVPEWANNWYRYQLARAKESMEEGNFLNFHRKLFDSEEEPPSDAHSPWRFCNRQWTTPVIDLLEIFDFVRWKEKDGETGD